MATAMIFDEKIIFPANAITKPGFCTHRRIRRERSSLYVCVAKPFIRRIIDTDDVKSNGRTRRAVRRRLLITFGTCRVTRARAPRVISLRRQRQRKHYRDPFPQSGRRKCNWLIAKRTVSYVSR